jgi:hypothetical protein
MTDVSAKLTHVAKKDIAKPLSVFIFIRGADPKLKRIILGLSQMISAQYRTDESIMTIPPVWATFSAVLLANAED